MKDAYRFATVLFLTVMLALTALATPASAGPGDGGGTGGTTGGTNSTPCTQGMWNTEQCDLVTVTPVRYQPEVAWVSLPLYNPQIQGSSPAPLQRGVTGTGQHTMRFDIRDFHSRMDSLCPTMQCGIGFVYTGPTSSDRELDIWVVRQNDGSLWHLAYTYLRSSPYTTFVRADTFALPWWTLTPTARRTMPRTDENGYNQWFMANPTGALFSTAYPGWSVAP